MGHGDKPHLDVARTCIGIADSYSKLKLYSEARSWYDSALIIQRQVIPNAPHPEKVLAFLNKKNTLQQLNYDHIAIVNQLDSALQYANLYSPATYIDALYQKADYFLNRHRQSKKIDGLMEAFNLFSKAINTLMEQRQMLQNKASKFHLSSTNSDFR